MKPEIKAIVDQHRKPKTKRQLLAEAQAREYDLKWEAKYKAEQQALVDAIPYESKKNFIRDVNKGMTVGNAARANGIDDIVIAAQILVKQIKEFGHYIEEIE